MKFKNLIPLFSLLFTILICFNSYGKDVKKEQIIIGLSQEPDSLDPLFGQMAASSEVLGAIFEGFTERNNKWELLTRCVKKRPSLKEGDWLLLPGNKMKTVWKINDNAVWSDGKPIKSYDVAFAHNVIMDDKVPVVSRDLDRRIEKINTPSEKIVEVIWKEKYAYADQGQTILPQHILEPVYKKDPSKYHESFYNTRPLGDGPYKVVEWVSGSHIILERNEKFYGERPKIKKIIFKFITDTNTLMANILSGDIDAIGATGITFDQGVELSRLGKSKGVEVYFTEGMVWEHIDFNLDCAIFKDKRVRAAMIYAIDREAIVNQLFEGKQKVAHSWLPPKHYGYNPDLPKYEYNPKKAIQLLKSAGWKLGKDKILINKKGEKFNITLMSTAGNKVREQVEQILQSYWNKIGIKIDIKNEPAKVFFGETTKKRKFPHLAMYAWIMSPIADGETLWTEENIPSEKNNWQGQNTPGLRNKEITRIDHLIPQTLDEKERIKLFHKQQELWIEELPSIPLYFRVEISVAKKSLKNWLPTGVMTPPTWNCEQWKWAM